MSRSNWKKDGWRAFPAKQQPSWPDAAGRDDVLRKISKLPALVFAGETRALKSDLAEAGRGNAFVLQGGDCAEDFQGCHGPFIHNLLNVILRAAMILSYGGEKRIIKIGRIAGQYAKPRSSDTEKVGGKEIPTYRGDMVNGSEPTLEARTPDPRRMLEGYFRSAATLNLLRAFTSGGYASPDQIQHWSQNAIENTPTGEKYRDLVAEIQKTVNFSRAIGLEFEQLAARQIALYTSHEALLLEYEEAMTRIDTTTGAWYDTSAHLLWIGDRTRQPGGAHVEFLRGVGNPLGLKVGPNHDVDEIKKIVETLNPANEAGRICLITRFGWDKVDGHMPKLVRAMRSEGYDLVYICDPMHGNTILNSNFRKTRKFDDIRNELRSFLQIHRAEGTVAAGVHLELTGEKVTECLGGSRNLTDKQLDQNYTTTCDPRLNVDQVVDLAFEMAEMLSDKSLASPQPRKAAG